MKENDPWWLIFWLWQKFDDFKSNRRGKKEHKRYVKIRRKNEKTNKNV